MLCMYIIDTLWVLMKRAISAAFSCFSGSVRSLKEELMKEMVRLFPFQVARRISATLYFFTRAFWSGIISLKICTSFLLQADNSIKAKMQNAKFFRFISLVWGLLLFGRKQVKSGNVEMVKKYHHGNLLFAFNGDERGWKNAMIPGYAKQCH